MSSTFASVAFNPADDEINRKPTAQELAEVPRMTKADVRKVMADPSYKASKLAQALVAASIQKGFLDEVTDQDAEPMATGDEIAARKAHVKNLFSDPRYRVDASYRLKVAQELQELTKDDHEALSPDALTTPNQIVRVNHSNSAYRGSDLTIQKYHKIDLAPQLTTSEAPAKKTPTREHFSE